MNTVLRTIVLICFTAFSGTGLFAQERTVAAGGEATGSGGSVSYSIGLIDYIHYGNSADTITEGIQQAFEIFRLGCRPSLGSNEKGINIKTQTFPNPASDFIVLSVDGPIVQNMKYTLTDAGGRIILSKNISTTETMIPMTSLPNATYFITTFIDNENVSSFKIVKRK